MADCFCCPLHFLIISLPFVLCAIVIQRAGIISYSTSAGTSFLTKSFTLPTNPACFYVVLSIIALSCETIFTMPFVWKPQWFIPINLLTFLCFYLDGLSYPLFFLYFFFFLPFQICCEGAVLWYTDQLSFLWSLGYWEKYCTLLTHLLEKVGLIVTHDF